MKSLLLRLQLAWRVLVDPEVAAEVTRVLIDDVVLDAVVALPPQSREQALREVVAGKHAR